jgi:short-subunit dehydrogenase
VAVVGSTFARVLSEAAVPAPSSVALVTGASSGIGRVYARRLARDGSQVVLTARREERLRELASEIQATGGRAEVLVADLATRGGLAEVERRAAAGDVTMLVNNAGYRTYMPFVELDPDAAEDQIHAQVTTIVRLCRAVLPKMIAQGNGAIVNVSSSLAFAAGMDAPHLPKRAVYAATKAFVNAFTETLAVELKETGVKVQALCPGVVRTEFHDRPGEPGAARPNVPVLEPEDVVQASLAALVLGDVVCVPALGDRETIERERAARHAIFGSGLSSEIAERYRVPAGK